MKGSPPVDVEESPGGADPAPLDAPVDDQVAPPAGNAVPVDGRAARSAKTRDAIADALLDLLAEGRMRPTAREIAERAGVSVRSVYVHFDDLEDLFCVAANRHLTRIGPMLQPVPATGTLAARAGEVVRQRAGLYAKVGTVGRATQLNAQFSPTLARVLREAHERSRADLERVFADELHDAGVERRAQIVAVLDVLTGSDAFHTLREVHGLPAATAMECLADSIVLLLRTDEP